MVVTNEWKNSGQRNRSKLRIGQLLAQNQSRYICEEIFESTDIIEWSCMGVVYETCIQYNIQINYGLSMKNDRRRKKNKPTHAS